MTEAPGPLYGRNNHTQQTEFLRLDFNHADNPIQKVGRLPRKAIVVRLIVAIKTSFDNDAKISIGTVADLNKYGISGPLVEPGRQDLPIPMNPAWEDDEEDIIIDRSAKSTVGEAAVIIEFIQNR